jgi:hypothetical protein
METSNWDDKPEGAGHLNEESARPRVSPQDLKARLDEINERIKTFIRERPAACLLGALALGYVAARLARRDR